MSSPEEGNVIGADGATEMQELKAELAKLRGRLEQLSSVSEGPSPSSSTADGNLVRDRYYKKEFKIYGTIGELGQKDRLTFSSLIHQINAGRRKGYREGEIIDAVVRAISPSVVLRVAVESDESPPRHPTPQVPMEPDRPNGRPQRDRRPRRYLTYNRLESPIQMQSVEAHQIPGFVSNFGQPQPQFWQGNIGYPVPRYMSMPQTAVVGQTNHRWVPYMMHSHHSHNNPISPIVY